MLLLLLSLVLSKVIVLLCYCVVIYVPSALQYNPVHLRYMNEVFARKSTACDNASALSEHTTVNHPMVLMVKSQTQPVCMVIVMRVSDIMS